MIVYNYDADLEVSDTCVRSSLLSILPIAVAWSSSAGAAIHYVLLVLWVTSYLHILRICTAEVPVGTASQPDGAASVTGAASLGQWSR